MPVQAYYDRRAAAPWAIQQRIRAWSEAAFASPQRVRLTANGDGVHLARLIEAACPACGSSAPPRGEWVNLIPPGRMRWPHSCGAPWRPVVKTLYWGDAPFTDPAMTVEGGLRLVQEWVAAELPALLHLEPER